MKWFYSFSRGVFFLPGDMHNCTSLSALIYWPCPTERHFFLFSYFFVQQNFPFKFLGLRDFCKPDSETLTSDTWLPVSLGIKSQSVQSLEGFRGVSWFGDSTFNTIYISLILEQRNIFAPILPVTRSKCVSENDNKHIFLGILLLVFLETSETQIRDWTKSEPN